MNTTIVSNGSLNDHSVISDFTKISDKIISVDGGIRHLIKIGLRPDIAIGDFDSASEVEIDYISENKIEKIIFPPEKDKTDLELAVDYAVRNGSNNIFVIAPSGSRIDHSLSNFNMLSKYALQNPNISFSAHDEKNNCYFINSTFTRSIKKGSFVSIIPITENITVHKTEGLKYPLLDSCINFGSTLGISNEATSDEVTIIIKSGLSLIVISKD